ncbi:hypothetical protein ANO14919_038380 [Xylariales sp. No.14919]|nr:hypothetical protein ANO14919_038380 [Xylariales sp. No.14919]
MASFGNRQAMLDAAIAVNFVESLFPRAHAHSPCHLVGSSPPPPPPPGVSAEEDYQGLPQGPPPGLVRVTPPCPAATRLITNEQVSLFSDFNKYLHDSIDEDGCPVVVDLTCAICMDRKLRVPDAVTARSDDGQQHAAREPLVVLPCGHFMGSDCLETWLIESEFQNEAGIVRCPLCRFELVYSCGHFIPPREYIPELSGENQLPLTLPEGGRIPRTCEWCCRGNIDDAIEKLRSLLFPEVLLNDLVWPESAEVLRTSAVQFKRRIWDFWGLNVHYNRW